jgi:hypothetical protein
MDMKILREKYYDALVGHEMYFRGADGLDYSGYLKDWFEDGTLIIDDLVVTARSYVAEEEDDGADYRYNNMIDRMIGLSTKPLYLRTQAIDSHFDKLTFIDGSFVRFIFAAYRDSSDDITRKSWALRERCDPVVANNDDTTNSHP